MAKVDYQNLYIQIEQVGQFFKRGRKKITNQIKQTVRELEKEIVHLTSKISELKKELDSSNNKNLNLEKKCEELNQKVSDLKKEIERLNQAISRFEIENIQTKYDLISEILASERKENEYFDKFKNLFREDFVKFANKEASLAEEAKAIIMLQDVEKELELIVSFSNIYNKNILSVGGGFSSGKSQFISSFFKSKEIKLPIGINPTTAIPTYIVPGEKSIIKGYSKSGGTIDIPPKLYQKLSHNFVKSFAFNLKDIMPLMAIKTPVVNFNHICFIDTPGYNPASSRDGYTGEDVNTARECLEQSNILLWLIGLDATGTIPDSDLDFINDLALKESGKKLYIVANKADLKSEGDLKGILDEFENVLEDEDLEYEGISAFDSLNSKEKLYRKNSLFDFLAEQDNSIQTGKKILSQLNKVFDMYEKAIKKEQLDTEKVKKQLKSLKLDLVQMSLDENGVVKERVEKIKKCLKQNI